jgi:hypothetical protein
MSHDVVNELTEHVISDIATGAHKEHAAEIKKMVGKSLMSAHDAHPDTFTNVAAVSHSQCYTAYIQANQTIVKEIDKVAAKLKAEGFKGNAFEQASLGFLNQMETAAQNFENCLRIPQKKSATP